MTVDEFIDKLSQLKSSLREKDIVITCPNGLTVVPSIKMTLKDPWDLYGAIDNVEEICITWE